METATKPKRTKRLLKRKKPTLDDLRREMRMVSVDCVRACVWSACSGVCVLGVYVRVCVCVRGYKCIVCVKVG